MLKLPILAVINLLLLCSSGNAQKTISEGTIQYKIEIQSKAKGEKTNAGGLNGATTTVYLKGGLSRADMTSSLGTETTIFNAKSGSGVILKEYSGQKLMISLTRQNWESRNKKFDGVQFTDGAQTKVIEGYNCKQAVAKLSDGTLVTVFYTTDIVAMNKEYNPIFKNLPGFPLEYQIETPRSVFQYTATGLDFSPVSATRFEFPKSGYRVMTYDENKGNSGEG